MKILVTGGAGFIGSNVVKLLLERGHEVSILDNLSTGYKKNIAPFKELVHFISGDIRDAELVTKSLVGMDGVCHLAASVGNKKSIDDPHHDASSNIQGVINILEGMRCNNVERISFSSSAGIFGEPLYQPVDEQHPCEPDSPYGATKLGGEKLILSYQKLYGLKAASLRYFNVYGENQRFDAYGNVIPIFVSRALKGEALTIFGDGEQTRDFIHVHDIALANVLCLENGIAIGPVNLGTGQMISINKLAQIIKDVVDADIDIIHKSERPGDVRHCTANVTKMKSLLNIEPLNIDEQRLRDYVKWFKSDLD
jgi:UDP-glucose 4-epimerase